MIGQLVRTIEAVARAHCSARVARVEVAVGARVGISPHRFRRLFSEGSEGTLAEGAALDLELSQDKGDPDAHVMRLTGVEFR